MSIEGLVGKSRATIQNRWAQRKEFRKSIKAQLDYLKRHNVSNRQWAIVVAVALGALIGALLAVSIGFGGHSIAVGQPVPSNSKGAMSAPCPYGQQRLNLGGRMIGCFPITTVPVPPPTTTAPPETTTSTELPQEKTCLDGVLADPKAAIANYRQTHFDFSGPDSAALLEGLRICQAAGSRAEACITSNDSHSEEDLTVLVASLRSCLDSRRNPLNPYDSGPPPTTAPTTTAPVPGSVPGFDTNGRPIE